MPVSLRPEVIDFYLNNYKISLADPSHHNLIEQERQAQLKAISSTFEYFFAKHPTAAVEIWDALRSAHVRRKANLTFDLTEEQITSVTSADQSWRKSSGHAAEAFFVHYCNPLLRSAGLTLLLQRDLSELLRQNKVKNEKRDIETISSWIGSDAFDIYAAIHDVVADEYVVYGCVQSKTSIRDRVTRDREPSTLAMSKYFWSVALVIDGTFLSLAKFQGMVDGGSASFLSCGWHGLYALHTEYESQRIFRMTSDFQPFVSHAKLASDQFVKNRQWLTLDWLPHIIG